MSDLVTDDELNSMVDSERGLISPHVFSSQTVYEQELARVFGKSWLFLAHESQIPKPGDFFSTYMGADPILVVRQRDGSVGAFLNACRHRGMKVCRADAGNAKAFTCTYHGWSYDTAGRLVNVPAREQAYGADLDTTQWGLRPVPRLETFRGFVFGCFDDSVPNLDTYLGDFKFYMDLYFDRVEGGVEMIGGVHKWKLQGNWKLAAEQFAGDNYHAMSSHISDLMMILKHPEGEGEAPGKAEDGFDTGRQIAVPEGHSVGLILGFHPSYSRLSFDPILDAYETSLLDGIEERLGTRRRELSGGMNGHFNVFPNLSWLGNHTIRVWHPKGPNAFECWSWIFVDKSAPEEVKDALRLGTQNQFSPAGMAEQDDGENWGLIGSNFAGRGPEIHKLQLNYTMAARERLVSMPDLPGMVLEQGFGEMPQRLFYHRWRELMKSDKWPEPAPLESYLI